jgi:hypothetical protein
MSRLAGNSRIAEQLIKKLNAVEAGIFEGQDATRQQLALAARKLFHKLETKEEKTMRLAIEELIMFSVVTEMTAPTRWSRLAATSAMNE